MKIFPLIGILLLTVFCPVLAWGGDSTLLMTFKTHVNQTILKNELRAGLWENGKDGFDPLDMDAMVNGVFDAYFVPSQTRGSSNRFLWWDIRSLSPSQVWKIQVKAPSGQRVLLEWKIIPFDLSNPSIWYSVVDTETGQETDLNNPSGTFTFSTSGKKTFILKSHP
ncbi:MAG: hypothetical protein ACHQYP_00750 [Nitrospiria bacterium]